jgi:serine/threonine-protein kinase
LVFRKGSKSLNLASGSQREANLTTATTSRAYHRAHDGAGGADAGPVLGRYELITRIASGGMATVWAARLRGSRGFQKIVALKTISPRFCSDAKYERMFLDEATFAGQIRHPNVAQILDLGEDNGVLYLAMEWIDGVTADDLLRAAHLGRIEIPLPVAIRVAIQTASGLHAAHELRDPEGELVGLVHGDVSPQNIIVSLDGVTKLVDFGIARLTANPADPDVSDVRGKSAYVAPEQMMLGTVDRRADIFALGIVLYMLTTGQHPFSMNGVSPALPIFRGPVRPPSEIVGDYPSELEATVLRCLERNPADRFATADELVWALESSLPSELRATDQDVAVLVRCLAGDDSGRRNGVLRLVGGAKAPSRPSFRLARNRSNTSPDARRGGDPYAQTKRYATASAAPPAALRPLVLCAAFLGSIGVLAIGSAVRMAATHGHAPPAPACAEHAPCPAPPTPLALPPAPVVEAAATTLFLDPILVEASPTRDSAASEKPERSAHKSRRKWNAPHGSAKRR